ncbi:hypothetical protein [Zymobacter sp. IVIA_12111.31 C1]|uniref:hypothetical protein n=1 Tax=Zymobacter sp. IVIA_12111.31 C1 TaxID=3394854 RepID=UPI0039C29282
MQDASTGKGPLGPEADQAFQPLTSTAMTGQVRIARLSYHARNGSQKYLTMPFERMLLRYWQHRLPGSQRIERWGLPRKAMIETLGDALILHVDPRQLIRIIGWPPRSECAFNSFIWDGDWDLKREDLRIGDRYRFISDIDEHRQHLEKTERYQRYLDDLRRGKPARFRQLGIRLDSPELIKRYLQVYLRFLDNMATHGFDADKGKDELGVAVSREGRLIKINKGLHRLAMAQRIGLPTVPVRVQWVHRDWWANVTDGARGAEALARVKAALPLCVPETESGPNDTEQPAILSEDFWPIPRGVASQPSDTEDRNTL